MKISIVGGGVMGQSLLAAALDRKVFDPSDVVVCELVEQKRRQIASEFGVEVTSDAAAAMASADFVVMSVKPQEAASVGGRLRPDAVLLSIMAGVRIETLRSEFGHERIIRAMPNTPVAARAGMTVWTATPDVSDEQREAARGLLQAVGREIYADKEERLDMATAVSGSGPAYVFLFIEALVEGAVAVGLARDEAEEMVIQTVLGAALFARESGRSPAELRGMVTSPAGTTAAGLLELERASLRAAAVECIRAAHRRSIELGNA